MSSVRHYILLLREATAAGSAGGATLGDASDEQLKEQEQLAQCALSGSGHVSHSSSWDSSGYGSNSASQQSEESAGATKPSAEQPPRPLPPPETAPLESRWPRLGTLTPLPPPTAKPPSAASIYRVSVRGPYRETTKSRSMQK